MPFRYAQVEISTRQVLNVFQVSTKTSVPPSPSGFRHIGEDEWANDQTPGVSDEWNGEIPAIFTEPVPGEQAATLPEALANMRAAEEALAAARRDVERIATGS